MSRYFVARGQKLERPEEGFSLKYLRTSIFYRFLRPFSAMTRSRRMQTYVERMGIREGMSILDLGGQPMIWSTVSPTLNLTILNLPGIAERGEYSHHNIGYVTGDACAMPQYAAGSFDSVFSNSVIEHVGDLGKQAAFASEVRRLGNSYWVQTPSKWFPVEAHNGMPFWWFYPESMRTYLIAKWREKLPEWTEMVEGTRVLTKAQMQSYFPEATILVEKRFGIPKSYIAYYTGPSTPR